MLTWPAPQIPQIPGHGGPVLVHDTTTGSLVEAAPGPEARLYVCGITPYDATHLGHAATYVAFDLLVRAWRDAGKHVTYASNVTDVDDPLLERATATGVDWRALALEQTALFEEDMTALGVIPPDVWVGAVESVPRVAAAVADLLARGAAYRVPLEGDGVGGTQPELGDVYADLSVDDAFGSVAHLPRTEMVALFGERGGDPDRAGKRDVLDPLLWRRERVGEPAWDGGDLGTGRPGWHIECAVIARDGLGASFDVQGGGSDLRFPHHEMSTSHVRVLTSARDDDVAAPTEPHPHPHGGARSHMHTGMVALDGQKMSKSLGNLELVSRLRARGVDAMAVRLALLDHHYRSDWEWTSADLDRAVARLDRWRAAVSGNGGPDASDTLAQVRAAVDNDLDAPRALRAVDYWADLALADAAPTGPGPTDADPADWADRPGWNRGAPGVIARSVNAILGVRL